MKLRSILVFKVKSQLCAWTTSAAVCVEGFCKKVKSQLCAWMTSIAVCAEGFCKKGSAAECADLQLSVQFVEYQEDL